MTFELQRELRTAMSDSSDKRKLDGVRVVHGHELDVSGRARTRWVNNIHPASQA